MASHLRGSVARLLFFVLRAKRRIVSRLLEPLFKSTGENFIYDPFGSYSFHSIDVGSDVSLGPGAILRATRSRIVIKDKVMFGPNVMVIGGDHNSTEVGRFMRDVTEKMPHNDQDIVINEDVWVGAGAIILKGVHIGRGAIVAAGAVVNRDVPPYTIAAGVPTRVVGTRFAGRELVIQHEEILYLESERLSREELEHLD